MISAKTGSTTRPSTLYEWLFYFQFKQCFLSECPTACLDWRRLQKNRTDSTFNRDVCFPSLFGASKGCLDSFASPWWRKTWFFFYLFVDHWLESPEVPESVQSCRQRWHWKRIETKYAKLDEGIKKPPKNTKKLKEDIMYCFRAPTSNIQKID